MRPKLKALLFLFLLTLYSFSGCKTTGKGDRADSAPVLPERSLAADDTGKGEGESAPSEEVPKRKKTAPEKKRVEAEKKKTGTTEELLIEVEEPSFIEKDALSEKLPKVEQELVVDVLSEKTPTDPEPKTKKKPQTKKKSSGRKKTRPTSSPEKSYPEKNISPQKAPLVLPSHP